jgi:signal transduction histidine kinase
MLAPFEGHATPSGGRDASQSQAYTNDGISGASRRLRALAALSGSLTDALSPKDAADLVEQKALSALDATSAIVVTLGVFPSPAQAGPAAVADQVLHVVHAIGVPKEIAAALEELPLDAPVPFAEVARTGEPLFIPSAEAMHRYPHWAEGMIGAGLGSAAVVPVWANGELRGVLGLAWPAPRVFDEDERAFVLTLGVMCAQAIMRAHLRAAERVARDDADVARQIAEAANKSKAEFVATISHELRTPMSAVIGYTSLLADEIYGPVSDLQREHIGRVQQSGTHLMGLIEDLLSFARIEAGHETVDTVAISLPEVVEASMDLVRPLARTKGLTMRVEMPEEPVTLYTDARKMRQILVNLLANAVKYSAAGEVSLVIRVAESSAEIRFRFEVADKGIGMTPAEQEKAFEPFWQANSNKTSGGGSGLGLSVARKMARLLGGDLFVVASAPGEGSTFVMTLPRSCGEPPPMNVALPAAVAS